MQNRLKEIISEAGFSPDSEVYSLKDSGSACKFYRIKQLDTTCLQSRGMSSAILLFIDGKHKDINSYVEISNFLKKIGVGVPDIYYYDLKNNVIIEEDLGDLTLQDYILETKDFDFYKKVIDELLLMQIMGSKKISECKCLKDKIFDYNAFRWESWYFRRYFLDTYCGVGTIDELSLQQEFHTLAKKLVDERLFFMHRDFQSRNILIKDGKVRIVDFQGAHHGLLTYDLASLLREACTPLPYDVQEKLVDYYLHCLSARWNIMFKPSHFRRIFLYTGLQRNMQALGAFAYLSAVEGKVQFSKYIPLTVDYLSNALEQIQEFPVLSKIITTIKNDRCY